MFPEIKSGPRSGNEKIRKAGEELGVTVLDFWRWSASDLLSNATRGVFAEFLVTYALGVPVGGVRNEWDAFDVLTPEGLKVEVKSAAYIQSWAQAKLSAISFGIGPTRGWDPATNEYHPELRRQADVYVFALLFHVDQITIDPLNLDQWRFYVVATETLNHFCRNQKRISLAALEKISGIPVGFSELRDAVRSTLSGSG